MVADTTTPLLQLLLQGTGNNNNAWGQNLNDQVISLLEQAVAGTTTIDVDGGGGSINLTDNQARSAVIVLTGALTSTLNIYVPSRSKTWRFINNTTGNFRANVTTAISAYTTLPQGKATDVTCSADGLTVYRSDRHQVGELFYYAGNGSPPPGALECDGSYKKRLDFTDLYQRIGTTWGSTDSTDFRLPPGNDTGRYIRGRTASVPSGTVQSNQNRSHMHTGSGSTSTESNTHYHTASGSTGTTSTTHYHNYSGVTAGISTGHVHGYSGSTSNESANHNHDYYGSPSSSNTPGGNFATGAAPSLIQTGNQRQAHYHNFSGITGSQSSDHVHAYSGSTGTESASHTHSYSFGTSNETSNHYHTYSFTTSTGSQDGTEARPESIVGILCIRY